MTRRPCIDDPMVVSRRLGEGDLKTASLCLGASMTAFVARRQCSSTSLPPPQQPSQAVPTAPRPSLPPTDPEIPPPPVAFDCMGTSLPPPPESPQPPGPRCNVGIGYTRNEPGVGQSTFAGGYQPYEATRRPKARGSPGGRKALPRRNAHPDNCFPPVINDDLQRLGGSSEC